MDVLIEENRVLQGIEKAEKADMLVESMGIIKQPGQDGIVVGSLQDLVTTATGHNTERISRSLAAPLQALGMFVGPVPQFLDRCQDALTGLNRHLTWPVVQYIRHESTFPQKRFDRPLESGKV